MALTKRGEKADVLPNSSFEHDYCVDSCWLSTQAYQSWKKTFQAEERLRVGRTAYLEPIRAEKMYLVTAQSMAYHFLGENQVCELLTPCT